MTHSTEPSITVSDQWITHPAGRLFARRWDPAAVPVEGAVPIVLLHDSLGCTALWREFPERLCAATGQPVIAYDRLGFGCSDPRSGRPSLNFVAEEAHEYFPLLREQLGLEQFYLFGHSVGGGMAIECAAAAGSACLGLITVAAQVFAEQLTLDSIAEAKQLFADPAQVARLGRYHGSKAEWVLHAWTDCWLDPGFLAWSVEAVLPRVTCPVLAIHGEHDEYGSSCHPQLIAECSGGAAQYEIVAGTYHVPHRENPELVLSLVTEFLRRSGR